MFVYEADERLPRLAWHARVAAGGQVFVRHGAGVETRPDGFVEGAWDGPFEEWNFDRAQTLAGSGARLRKNGLTFAAPFHPLERLFVLRTGDELHVSNSLAFLLVETGDGLDPSHPDYFFDFIRQVRRGIAPPLSTLPTAAGRQVALYPVCNLDVVADGDVRRVDKPTRPPFQTYGDYAGHLLETTATLSANAASPARRTPFRLVAACSRGYDSTASAAIAGRAGCREGVTFRESRRAVGHPLAGVTEETGDDSGADTLRALGMRAAEFDRRELNSLPGHPRAEFFISSPAAITDATMRVMEPVLEGSVLVSGRHGERYWGPTTRCRRRDLREVDDCHLSGQALGEFRLRAGFLHYPLPYVGARHGPSIFRITHAPEMRPWRLGSGYYDRPIPRRIAEEAGVPRGSFGVRKLGAGLLDRAMSAASEKDFADFVRDSIPDRVRRRLDMRPYDERIRRHRLLAHARTMYAHWPVVGPALDVLGTDRFHAMWNAVQLYHFHWGFEKTSARYTRQRVR